MSNRRIRAIWQRVFDREFQQYRHEGVSEDMAIQMAERDAEEAIDRYWEEKLQEMKDDGLLRRDR